MGSRAARSGRPVQGSGGWVVELSAGWHGIGHLPPGARLAAVLLPLVLGIVLSVTMRERHIQQASILGADQEHLADHPGWAHVPVAGE